MPNPFDKYVQGNTSQQTSQQDAISMGGTVIPSNNPPNMAATTSSTNTAGVQPSEATTEPTGNPFAKYTASNNSKQTDQQAPPKQSSFMDMVDAFNGVSRDFANGELQLILKGANAIGIDTTNTQKKLAADSLAYNNMANEAHKNSPYAAATGTMLAMTGNVLQTASQGGGIAGFGAKALGLDTAKAVAAPIAGMTGEASVPGAAASALGRMGNSAILTGTEQALEYGTPEERAQKGISGSVLGALGQGSAELLGMGVRAGLNKLIPSKAVQGMILGETGELPKSQHLSLEEGLGAETPKGTILNEGGLPVDESGDLAPITYKSPKEQPGVPMTLGQASGNEGIQTATGLLSKIPLVGSKNNIQKAYDAMYNQAGNTLDALGVNQQSTGDLSKAFLETTKQSYYRAKNITNQAYNNALNIGEMEGNRIRIPGTNEAIAKASDSLNALSEQEGIKSLNIMPKYQVTMPANGEIHTMGSLRDAEALRDSIAPIPTMDSNMNHTFIRPIISKVDNGSQIGTLLGELKTKEDISPSNFDALRKEIKGLIGSNILTDQNAANKLTDIKDAMDKDLINQGATDGSNFGKALQTARATFIQQVKPFKDSPILSKAVKDDFKSINPDDLMKSATKNDSPFLANTIINNSSDEGKNIFTTAVVQKAAKNSMEEDGKTLNLDSLLSNLHKMGETTDQLPDNARLALKGLQEVLYRGNSVMDQVKPTKNISSQAWGLGAATLAGIGGLTGGALGMLGGASLPVIAKVASSMLTNPNLLRQAVRLGKGGLSDDAKKATIKFLLERTLVPATITSVKNRLREKQQEK